MADVRVICPKCQAELELGEEHLGQEVECGNCLEPFVAKGRPKDQSRKPRSRGEDEDRGDDEDRPKRRRKRRNDEDDEYDYRPNEPASGGGGGAATASLILGILSFPFLCCCHLNVPISIAGIICGIVGLQGTRSKGLATTGLILSILSLAIYGAFLLIGFGANFNNPLNLQIAG